MEIGSRKQENLENIGKEAELFFRLKHMHSCSVKCRCVKIRKKKAHPLKIQKDARNTCEHFESNSKVVHKTCIFQTRNRNSGEF